MTTNPKITEPHQTNPTPNLPSIPPPPTSAPPLPTFQPTSDPTQQMFALLVHTQTVKFQTLKKNNVKSIAKIRRVKEAERVRRFEVGFEGRRRKMVERGERKKS